uniref:Transcription antitermination protein NusB n=1 Tax=candidate division WOR-3 bacterium TaxID=2052148 RepID=A0A7C4XJW0_UNCW3
MSRRLARELALKILYGYECGLDSLPELIAGVLGKKNYKNGVKNYCRELVTKTINHLSEIDRMIIEVLKNWNYERVSLIDKLILRMGTCEILYFPDIPNEVSINEAIEIGKKYGSEESGKFINGVLDAVKKRRKEKEENEGRNNQ